MTRRSISILLGAFALFAAVLVWISISVIGEPSGDESNAPVEELRHSTQALPDPSLSPPPSPDSISQAPDAATTARAAVPQAPRESAELSGADHELRDELWVEGRVVVPPGTPPDELVEVVAIGKPQETPPLHRSPIAADGSFRVAFPPGTRLGTLDLVAKYLYLEQRLTLSVAPPPQDVLLTPHLGGRIHARIVLSPAALPRRSSVVGSFGQAQRPGWPGGEFRRTGKIDELLELDLNGLAAGPDYEIWVAGGGCTMIPLRGVQVVPGRTTFVDLDLDLAARVSGWVFDANGRAMGGTQVLARLVDPDSRFAELHHSVTASSGLFVLSPLTAGVWELSATAIGFAKTVPLCVQLSPGQSVEDVRLELRRSGRIEGRVLGVDGKPAAYAGLSVRSDQPRDLDLGGTVFLAGTSMTTDKLGDFEFDSLAPGIYRIEVNWADPANGGEASRPAIVLAEAESVENVVIRIERPGRIEGRVMGPEGRPAVDAFVLVKDAETGIARSGSPSTDESGKFTLERVPPGEFLLEVRGVDLTLVGEARIAVRPGEVVRTEISLQAGTMLSVVLEGFGEDPGAVTVSIHDEEGLSAGSASPTRSRSSSGLPDETLVCTFGPLLTGRYVVEAAAAGKKVSHSVTLSGQRTESVRLRAGN